MKITGKAMRWIWVACAAQIAVGCIIFPPQIHYNSYLVPVEKIGNEAPYRVEKDGSVYALAGLRIDVKFTTDAELNALLPEDSHRGEYSTNPYTYGDYIDRDVGYTPNRFTVFKVSVFNQTFAKVQLYPLKAILLTDQGRTLHSYGMPSTSPYKSFERYYRGLRGQSGNEFYRFEVRMGHVRSLNYAEDQPIFKGESYGGLIAFDALDPAVEKVRLILKEFALKFDEFDTPLETVDIRFDFNRRIEKWEVKKDHEAVSFDRP